MFEEDLTALSTPDLLQSAAAHRAEADRLEARLIVHAQIYADRHHPDLCPARPGRRPTDGRERAIVLGGDGCPEIAEFAPAEFGAMIGISAQAAAGFIGQALALQHRLPLTWARVLAGEATPWKARKIATACLDLSEEAARAVDRRVARLVDSLTPIRLDKIVEAAKKHADPEGARKKAEEKNRERGVYLGRSDEHGTRKISIRTPSGHANRFNAKIGSIAEALKIFGDTRNVQHRRAEAVGIIADSRYTEELLHQAHQHLRNTPPAPPEPPPTTSASDPTADAATDADAARTATGQGATPDADTVTAQDAAATAERGSAPTSERVPDGGNLPPADQAAWARSSTSDPATVRDTSMPGPGRGAERGGRARDGEDQSACLDDEGLLGDWAEPGLDDEADRDAPYPGDSDLPDPLDAPFTEAIEPFDSGLRLDLDDGEPLDADARRALDARLAQIRHDAHTNPRTGRPVRPGQTEIYVHITDHTLATGTGVLRVEDIGPSLASQLSELVGHGPYTVKPVIDLHDAVSVDAYEIPDRIRERVKLLHPVELFPYGTRETNHTIDIDHIQPYDPLGPPGQTNTANLAPLGRFPQLSRPGARCRDCSRSVSPGRSPNPPCVFPRNGLSMASAVGLFSQPGPRGWGSCCRDSGSE